MMLTLTPMMSMKAKAEGHDHAGWTEWSATSSLPTTAGNCYLSGDVTLSSYWNVPTGTVNLCLNTHTINLNSNYILVSNGTLNLYDCPNGSTEGSITGATGVNTALRVEGGTATMNGGTIRDNSTAGVNIGKDYGTGNVGSFTMNGGSIKNNNAANGAGVNLSLGSFIMNGGVISNSGA